MVRAFAHGAMGRRIDPSWGGPIQCSTTSTKAVICVILSVGRVAHVEAAGSLSHYLYGPLPYVRRHITVKTMC